MEDIRRFRSSHFVLLLRFLFYQASLGYDWNDVLIEPVDSTTTEPRLFYKLEVRNTLLTPAFPWEPKPEFSVSGARD